MVLVPRPDRPSLRRAVLRPSPLVCRLATLALAGRWRAAAARLAAAAPARVLRCRDQAARISRGLGSGDLPHRRPLHVPRRSLGRGPAGHRWIASAPRRATGAPAPPPAALHGRA